MVNQTIFAKIVEPVEGRFCTSIGLVNPVEGCHFMMPSNPISMVELSGFVFFVKECSCAISIWKL
jgi:hypothetical protein